MRREFSSITETKAAIHIFDVAKLDRVSRKEKLDRGKKIRETVSVCEGII